jgi:hypothetical protein
MNEQYQFNYCGHCKATHELNYHLIPVKQESYLESLIGFGIVIAISMLALAIGYLATKGTY